MIYGRKQCDPDNACGRYYDQFLDACPYCGTSEHFSSFKPYNPIDWVYDLESYPNIFTASLKHPATRTRQRFEISERRNDGKELYNFLNVLAGAQCRMIGFNNIGYDYPMIHHFIKNFNENYFDVRDMYRKNDQIINTPWNDRFSNVIWDNDTLIKQIDLFKIHHFDNEARRTSLKMLEFNMRSNNIQDLPFEPGTILTDAEQDELIVYNDHDVDETEQFYFYSLEQIEFREQLTEKHGVNHLNFNDKKIGTHYLITELEKNKPGCCYARDVTGRKITLQTRRPSIALDDIIFSYINFKQAEFNRVLKWLKSQVITETKGVFTDVHATIDGFKYDFGTGGIHGSIDSTIVESDENYVIYDWDVASFYPNIAIKNKLFPEHLSELFCDIYNEIYEQRKGYKKGTALNAALKLALNGSFGDSNNKYSPLFDPAFTMGITVNGQLLLCMLAQYLIDIPDLQMIQINTDGLTVRCPRHQVDAMKAICKWWEDYTCLELESVVYSRMFIRDVNNYIAEYSPGGKLKSKGAYVYKTRESQKAIWTPNDMDWNQNYSALVVSKAAEAALVHGQDIRDFIESHDNLFDFMLRTKVSRKDRLVMRTPGNERNLQKISRYYISNAPEAGALFKIAPPTAGYQVGQWKRATKLTHQFYNGVRAELAESDVSHYPPTEIDTTGLPWDARINTKSRSKYEMRETGFNVGYLVKECNDIRKARRDDINIDYYVAEAEKLVNPLRG